MRKMIILLLLLIAAGCSPKILPPVQKDSVRVEYRTQLVVVRDTAYVEIPQIREDIVTIDTVSHLENQYAESYAAVADGLLYHSLETKPQKIAAPVETTVVVRDTTIYQERVVEVPVEKIVRKTPRWAWRLLAFNFVLALVAFMIIYRKLRKID